MTTVAITGPTGVLGRALCRRLQSDPAVERIVGLARRPFDPLTHGLTKMVYRRGDVAKRGDLVTAMDGADVLVHLAFVVSDRGVDPAAVRAVNVDGSRNVVEAAVAAGARRIVYASSIAAYGAHPDNPIPIREDHATRGQDGLYYAEHKALVERFLDDVEAHEPGVTIIRMRPCTVVGPTTLDQLSGPLWALRGLARLLRVLPDPGATALQLVHEDDVAQAFALAITTEGAAGAYNLAGGGTITLRDLAQRLGAIRIPVPLQLAQVAADLAYRIGVSPFRAAWLGSLLHPVVVDTTKARTELGWTPRYDTRTALDATLALLGR